jgi:hypothetical protein
MNDPTYARIVLLLTRVFSGANPFFLGKLGGRNEQETAKALNALAEKDLAISDGVDRWILTEKGLAACNPQHRERPAGEPTGGTGAFNLLKLLGSSEAGSPRSVGRLTTPFIQRLVIIRWSGIPVKQLRQND